MRSALLLVGAFAGDFLAETGYYSAAAEPQFKDDVAQIQEFAGPEESAVDRKLAADDVSKNMAIHTLQKMHKAHKMFEAYKKEKGRLERRAIVSYLVGGVFVLLFGGGAARYGYKIWQTGQLPTEDEEALMHEEHEVSTAAAVNSRQAMQAMQAKPADEQRLMGPDTDDPLAPGGL
jgi:hypothetical protein